MDPFAGKLTFIPKTHKAHTCDRCGTSIPMGSSCYKKPPKHFGEQEAFWCESCKEQNERLLH